MGKVSDRRAGTAQPGADGNTRGCGGRTYSCECGYDSKTERLLRAAAQRIEQLEATLRGDARTCGTPAGGRGYRPWAGWVACAELDRGAIGRMGIIRRRLLCGV